MSRRVGLRSMRAVGVAFKKIHIFYYEDTDLKRKIWDGETYSSEETLVSGEVDISQLIAYPSPLRHRFLLNWTDGTNVRFLSIRNRAVLALSTVDAGSLMYPQTVKPYYYNGYYYVFYASGGTIYYKTSPDGTTWSDAVSVAPLQYGDWRDCWAVMGIDDKILLVRIYDDYHKTRVGTIEDDHTILWGADADLGITDTRLVNRRTNCYVTKVGGVRKMFVLTTTPRWALSNACARVYVSDDDGVSWTNLGYCTDFGGWFLNQFFAIPFNDGNKLEEIFTMVWIDGWGPSTYNIKGRFRDGSTCASYVSLNGFRNQYYINDQAVAVFDGTYVNLFYIDNLNNLLHKRVTANGTWETVGTVKSGIHSDAGVTVICE